MGLVPLPTAVIASGAERTEPAGRGAGFMWWLVQERSRATIQNKQDGFRIANYNTLHQQGFTCIPAPLHTISDVFLLMLVWLLLCFTCFISVIGSMSIQWHSEVHSSASVGTGGLVLCHVEPDTFVLLGLTCSDCCWKTLWKSTRVSDSDLTQTCLVAICVMESSAGLKGSQGLIQHWLLIKIKLSLYGRFLKRF